jgi:very-short-patch-repair endonuclease
VTLDRRWNRSAPDLVCWDVFDSPFRGREAVAAGLVTPGQLRGPRFRRLFSGIFIGAQVDVDYATRCRAGALTVRGRGVLGGWSAAELLGASCAPRDAPVELIVCGSSTPSRAGLVVRADHLVEDEITTVQGVAVTTAVRTAFDLGRRPPITEAICAVDAITRCCGVSAETIMMFAERHSGARGIAQLPEVLRRSSPLAESPMESRIRVAIEDAGLPAPVLQHRVGPYLLDLAYPALRLGLEYDGQHHLTAARAMRDLTRQAYLSTAGWEVLRFPAREVFLPRVVAARTRAAMARRAAESHRCAEPSTNR